MEPGTPDEAPASQPDNPRWVWVLAQAISEVWDKTNEALPGSDITMVYKHLRDGAGE